MELLFPVINYDERGLVPVIAQDADSGQVLMLAYADREALSRTLETKEAHYFSRSRGELWRKGASSGHTQDVVSVHYDCDSDALLYRVRSLGPACHTGERSCFYRALGEEEPSPIGQLLYTLERVIDARLSELTEGSYVTRLHKKGVGHIAQKVIEEAGETAVAALQDGERALVGETADLLFHVMVLLRERGVRLSDVGEELSRRHAARTAPPE